MSRRRTTHQLKNSYVGLPSSSKHLRYCFLLLQSINAVLDIDHLILSLVNTFKEQHFSLGTPKLSGQLKVLLGINPSQYSIEANFEQLQLSPFNVIDPTHVSDKRTSPS